MLLAFAFQHVLADSLAESSPFRAIQALQNRPHLATAFGMPTGPSRNDTGLLTVDRCRLSETCPECSDEQRVALQVKTSVVVRQAQDPHQPRPMNFTGVPGILESEGAHLSSKERWQQQSFFMIEDVKVT